jgi:hypothetical protein
MDGRPGGTAASAECADQVVIVMSDEWTIGVPVLSRGRHRNARKGGCFMEFASYLAGQPWSDHPDCTDPLLALVAREVNDETSDRGRTELAPLIPSVIGVTTDDPRLPPALVARCVRLVLPVVSPQFQCVLAVALLSAEHVLADLEHRPRGDIRAVSVRPLNEVPVARSWAEAFIAARTPSCYSRYASRYAPRALAGAVRAVTDFRTPNADQLLRQLLVESIDECQQWMPTACPKLSAPAEHASRSASVPSS